MALSDALVGVPRRRTDAVTRPLLNRGRDHLVSLANYEEERERDDIMRRLEALRPEPIPNNRSSTVMNPMGAQVPTQARPTGDVRLPILQRNIDEQRDLMAAVSSGATGPQADRRRAGLFAALGLLGLGVGALTGGQMGAGRGIAAGLTGGARQGLEAQDLDFRQRRQAFLDELRREQAALEARQQGLMDQARRDALYRQERRDVLTDRAATQRFEQDQARRAFEYEQVLSRAEQEARAEREALDRAARTEQVRLREQGLTTRNRESIAAGRYQGRGGSTPDSTLIRLHTERERLLALPENWVETAGSFPRRTRNELLEEVQSEIDARTRVLEQTQPGRVPGALQSQPPGTTDGSTRDSSPQQGSGPVQSPSIFNPSARGGMSPGTQREERDRILDALDAGQISEEEARTRLNRIYN